MTRVMIVDDQPQNRYLLEVLLKHHGYEVTSASNGAEALATARETPPDLIVSDVLMPVMDGFALCRAWRADEALAPIPFIFYTATYTQPQDEEFALSLGADRYIIKPSEPKVLARVVAEVLAGGRGRRPAAPAQPLGEEMEFFRQHNAVLFQKLEKKVASLELEIARRREIERALGESEKRFRNLFERNLAGVFRTNLAGRVLDCNTAFAQMLGFDTPGEVCSQPAISLYARTEDRDAFLDAIRREKRLINYEFRGRRKDGTPFFGLENVSLIEEEEEPELLEGTVIDITKRRTAERRVQLQLRRLAGLRAIDSAISTNLDARTAFKVCIAQALDQLEVDAVSILLAHPPSRDLECAAALGFATESVWHERLHLEATPAAGAHEGEGLSLPDVRAEGGTSPRRKLLEREGFRAYFAAPFFVKGRFRGLLEVFRRTPLTPDPEWMDFLAALAGQAGIALDNASLFEDLQRSNQELALAYDSTLEGWTHALEMRDRETQGHTLRAAEMTLRLARAVGLPEHDSVHVWRGALLHDIGKVGIPDAILLKPGPLTDEEWAVMRRHPEYAFSLLSPIGFLKAALEIPYCHHERWDGTGYPRGLKGEEIPLAARVFSVVDVWDALSFERPYRPAWPKERVLTYLAENAGSQFDPQVVPVFLDVIRDGG